MIFLARSFPERVMKTKIWARCACAEIGDSPESRCGNTRRPFQKTPSGADLHCSNWSSQSELHRPATRPCGSRISHKRQRCSCVCEYPCLYSIDWRSNQSSHLTRRAMREWTESGGNLRSSREIAIIFVEGLPN